jgi:hypothetical protein
LVCERAIRSEAGPVLENIFDTVIVEDGTMPFDLKCNVVVGCVMVPEMYGTKLDAIAWKLNDRMERETLPGWVGTKLTLGDSAGPQVLPFLLTMPVTTSGYYGFDLWDPLGVFGSELKGTAVID